MKKEQVFCLILTAIVSGVFLTAVYFTFRPGQTTIIMGADTSRYLHQTGPHQNSNYNKTTNEPSKSKNDQTTSKEEQPISSFTSEELVEVSTPKDTEHSSTTPSESSTSSDSSSSSSDSVEKPNQDFSKANSIIKSIENCYSISITLNTKERPVESSTAFEEAHSAEQAAEFLEQSCSYFSEELFKKIKQKNYHIEMILSGSSETNISVSKNGTSIVYHLNVSPYDWTTMFCYQTAKLVDLILMELSEKSQLYSEYSQYNPDSFEYGKLNASLIESSPSNTYFYNLASQKSIQEDRLQLYTHFLKGNIDRSYLTNSCPMYQKLQVIKLQITTYILS